MKSSWLKEMVKENPNLLDEVSVVGRGGVEVSEYGVSEALKIHRKDLKKYLNVQKITKRN